MVPHVNEGCPNPKLEGVEGVDSRHDPFEERRVALGGYLYAGEYMWQLIRGAATEQHHRRLRGVLVDRELGRGDAPDGDAR